MQICGIHAHQFLSLSDFHWEDIDPGLNVLVGPNGSGKTNVLRAVGTVVESLAWAEGIQNVPDPFTPQDFLTLGDREGWYDISVEVVFDTEAERDLLTSYFQVAMLDVSTIQRLALSSSGEALSQIPAERLHTFAAHVTQAVTPKQLEPLFRGRLGFRCWARGESEYLCYFAFGEQGTERFILLGPGSSGLLTDSLPSRPLRSYGSTSLLSLYWSRLTPEEQGAIRSFLAGECAEVTLPCLDLGALWEGMTQGAMGNVELNAQLADGSSVASYVLLMEKLGLSIRGGVRPHLGMVMRRILKAAVFRTENVRIRPKRTYPVIDFQTRSANLSSGEDLVLHLFRLKNGTAEQRLAYKHLQRSFRHLMPGAQFDVRAVFPSPAEQSHSGYSGDREQITLQAVISHKEGDVPLEASGAGMAEAIYLVTVLEEAADRVLMLDEPALNLHPSIQRRLLRHIVARTSQTIVVTHSPYLVPINRLQTVRRAANLDRKTVLSARFAQMPRRQQEIQLPRTLERSRDAVAALFATCVLLVEGAAELAALPIWFEKETGGELLEDYGAEICPVHGKNNLGLYVAYLDAFGIPRVVMVDGDALQLGSGNAMRQFGYANVQLPQCADFAHQKAELMERNIFVMGDTSSESFESRFIDTHASVRPADVPHKGPALAFWTAESLPCPPEIAEVFRAVIALARRHQR